MKIMMATLVLVYFKAIQQQNVIHGNYAMAAVTPYILALCEVATVLWVVDTGWTAVPWVGTGGAVGVVAGMLSHRAYRNQKKSTLEKK